MSLVRKNRAHWNSTSDAYQAEHGSALREEPLAWGVWRIPEAELGVLGELEGREVLELGCGAAQWAAGLATTCARVVGIDLSERQLANAQHHLKATDARATLVQGDAEGLPFLDRSFDVVFCDHGAMTFAQPQRTVAEASRVLRPDGVFAFCMSSPIRDVCWDERSDRVTPTLVGNYFELDVLEDSETACFQLPYGAWIRLFREHSLVVEDLVELRPAPTDTTTYSKFVDASWANQWPAENIWKLRKVAG
jgi:SAM-dependent methyltransferase